MNGNTNYMIRMLAGAYLVYLGISLIKDELSEGVLIPLLTGVAFTVIGAGLVIYSFVKFRQGLTEEQEMEEDQEIEEEE